jgi:hypothetical protein
MALTGGSRVAIYLNVFKTYEPSNHVYAMRVGRIVFGLVVAVGAIFVALNAGDIAKSEGAPRWHTPELIGGTWLVALLAAIVSYVYIGLGPCPKSPHALRKAALAVPSAGIALLLPITIHVIVMHDSSVHEIDQWVAMSVLLTSHVHIVLALLVGSRALALANDERPVSIPVIYTITCLGALIPMIIPMFFVAITGIPIIPLLLWMKRVARLDLERSHQIPFAIARTV